MGAAPRRQCKERMRRETGVSSRAHPFNRNRNLLEAAATRVLPPLGTSAYEACGRGERMAPQGPDKWMGEGPECRFPIPDTSSPQRGGQIRH
jgi:hypothetical protein